MSEIELLEKRVESLSAEDLAKFRAWFVEFDARTWDQEIEADATTGRLRRLVADALTAYKDGKAREI